MRPRRMGRTGGDHGPGIGRGGQRLTQYHAGAHQSLLLPGSDFNDVTTGYNGYSVTTGYDLVTGLGTPKANLLVAGVLAANGVTATSTTSSAAPRQPPRRPPHLLRRPPPRPHTTQRRTGRTLPAPVKPTKTRRQPPRQPARAGHRLSPLQSIRSLTRQLAPGSWCSPRP